MAVDELESVGPVAGAHGVEGFDFEQQVVSKTVEADFVVGIEAGRGGQYAAGQADSASAFGFAVPVAYSGGMNYFGSFAADCRRGLLRAISALAIAAVVVVPRTSPEQSDRELVGTIPGTTLVVTANEGVREPHSIGSYALRLYAPFDTAWPYDNYIDGAIRPRDGVLNGFVFGDLDADGALDIVVVVRSAGSGGYLSADGFVVRAKRLTFVGHVEGLSPLADPLIHLQKLVRRQRELP